MSVTKGIYGFSIGIFELVRLHLKYVPEGKIAQYARAMASDLDADEELFNMKEEEFVKFSESHFEAMYELRNYCINPDDVQFMEGLLPYKMYIYPITHDLGDEHSFIVGEELFRLDNGKKDSSRGKVRQIDDELQVRLTSVKKFVELTEKKTGLHIVQNDCHCCS